MCPVRTESGQGFLNHSSQVLWLVQSNQILWSNVSCTFCKKRIVLTCHSSTTEYPICYISICDFFVWKFSWIYATLTIWLRPSHENTPLSFFFCRCMTYILPSTIAHYFGIIRAGATTVTPTMLKNIWTEMIADVTGVRKFTVTSLTSLNTCNLSGVGQRKLSYKLKKNILFLFPFLLFLEQY